MTVDTGTSETQTISLAVRLEAMRETKIYDLLAAAPVIVFFGVVLAVRLPDLARQVMTTDWTAADVAAISSITSKFVSLIFITMLIAALMALRYTPRARASGLMPRITNLRCSHRRLAPHRSLKHCAHFFGQSNRQPHKITACRRAPLVADGTHRAAA